MLAKILICVALAAPPFPADSGSVDLRGSVIEYDGRPVNDAAVCIVSAQVRVGTSSHCPTCYPDCAKRAATGRDGAFVIPGLSSVLVFQVVVVAEGFEPALVRDVNPRNGSLKVRLKVIDPGSLKKGHVLSGRVLDPKGGPVQGALVRPIGWKTSTSRWRGPLPGVDPRAVTNRRGEFLLRSKTPNVSLSLRVEAAGLATTIREVLPLQAEHHTIKMRSGVLVTGRVVSPGASAGGVTVGLVQADQSSVRFLGNRVVRTDASGRFHFWNVGAGEDYYVYGTMEDASRLGVGLPVVKVRTKQEGEDVSPIILKAVPCYRVRGRVTVSGGKPLPAGFKLCIVRREAWDFQELEVGRDGAFTFMGVPPELIEVDVPSGYHLAPENKSRDPFRPSHLVGRVIGDVTNLRILVKPGEEARVDIPRLPRSKGRIPSAIEKAERRKLRKLFEQLEKAEKGALHGVEEE